MIYLKQLIIALIISLVTVTTTSFMNIQTQAAEADVNPLLENWSGPFGGLPPFDKVKVRDLKPALESAMAKNLKEIDHIAGSKAAPTFENTIEALERSGQTLRRVQTVFDIWTGSLSTPEVEKVEADMAPRLAGFSDKIFQNAELFGRIESVYNSPGK